MSIAKKKNSRHLEKIDLRWKVHTPNFTAEILENNQSLWMVAQPMNIFRQMLGELAEIAQRIDDPELHDMMCRLTLYEEADPASKEFDPEKCKLVAKMAAELKAKRLKDGN